MAVYMIFIREEPVRDPESLATYQGMNQKNIGAFKMKPLVVYGATEAVEGTAPDGIVMLEFATVEEAKAFYYSPAYQSALPFRQKAADYRALIVQGL